MKIKEITGISGIVILMLIGINLYAQPQGFNYQALAHQDGNPLANTGLDVEISIIQGTPGGNTVFTESHDVTTNDQGLFSLIIGDGSPILSSLEAIDWGSGNYFLSVKFKKSTDGNFLSPDIVKLQSVPYALFAESSKGIGWEKNSDTIYSLTNVAIGTSEPSGSELAVKGLDINSEQPLFEVKRNDGVPVFAVYNDGVMVFVNENSKGTKGGFAVGGYNSAAKGVTNEYLRVTPDSVRIYVNDNPAKGLKGGFAVGGYNSGKSEPFEFMSLTPENYFIGHESGSSITTGSLNSFMGYQSGKTTTTGNYNVFMGPNSGQNNISGSYNVILGSSAGQLNNGSYNVFIGYESGQNNVSGADSRFSKFNTFIGYQSGKGNTTGWNNLDIGYRAGFANQVATNQFFIGNQSGEDLTDGYGNTFVGHLTGANSTSVSENTFIGYQSGYNNYTGTGNTFLGNASGLDAQGSGNVFIGNRVGWYEDGNNLLYIDNSSTTSPLIYGDFSGNVVKINGSLGVGVIPTQPLAVAGLTGTTSGSYLRVYLDNIYYYSSSRETKTDIHPFIEEFTKILEANPVKFTDKTSGEENIGYIAEDFDELGLNDLVIYENGKPKSLSYELISLYNLEIIKMQQETIREKEKEIEALKARLARIEEILDIQ